MEPGSSASTSSGRTVWTQTVSPLPPGV